jgi:hypothetical protein
MTAQFGVDFHQSHQLRDYGDVDFNAFQLAAHLKDAGVQSVRLGLEWWDIDPSAPSVAFDPHSASMSAQAFTAYISSRWGQFSNAAANYYDYFHQAYLSGIKVVANFGVIPPWAQTPNDANGVVNSNYPGEFLADFVVYLSRQTDGIATLENIESIQIFNEVNGIYGGEGQTQWANGLPAIPYNTYFDIVAAAMNDVYNALASIGVPLSEAPKIAAPDLGGSYDPLFFKALNNYTEAVAASDGVVTTNASVWTASGHLAIQEIDLHAYGETIQAWYDPTTLANVSLDSNIIDNLTYNRMIAPTMDFMTWRALVDRGSVPDLALYSASNNPGDAFFDMNTGIGVERTMADLYQAGDANVSVAITEFGASTFVGNGTSDDVTSFANPYEYGVIQQGQLLTQAMAENLQTIAVMESVCLIRTWSFVTEADAYEMYDETNATGSLAQYGLAYGLNPNGSSNFKPAGLAYSAWLNGQQYDCVANLQGLTGLNGLAAGFDVHIASSAGTLGFINNIHNELVILRGPNDNYFSYAGGAGDLVVFADNYNTTLIGGSGYNELYGGSGNDTLIGGSGYNQLVGGSGDDILQGGGDVGNEFVFSEYAASGSGNSGQDQIVNFDLATDTLTLVGGYSASVLTSTSAAPLLQDVAGGLLITLANNGASVFLKNVSEAQFTAALNGSINPYVIHGLESLAQSEIFVTSASRKSISEASSNNDVIEGSRNTVAIATGADLTVNGNSNIIDGASNDLMNVIGKTNTITASGSSDTVVVGGNGRNSAKGIDDIVNLSNGFVYEETDSTVDFYGSNTMINIGANDILRSIGSALTIDAYGTHEHIYIGGNGQNATSANDDIVNLTSGGFIYENANSTVVATGSHMTASMGANSSLSLFGSNDSINLGSTDSLWLHSGAIADKLNFDGDTGATDIIGFSQGDTIDLLGGTGGFKSASAAFHALRPDGNGGSFLSLGANGSIDLENVAVSSLSAADFKIG